MNKLNWRDASKELPTKFDDNGNSEMCLILHYYKNKPLFQKDWINKFTKDWTYSNGDQKYWIYLDEIPLPEEEL